MMSTFSYPCTIESRIYVVNSCKPNVCLRFKKESYHFYSSANQKEDNLFEPRTKSNYTGSFWFSRKLNLCLRICFKWKSSSFLPSSPSCNSNLYQPLFTKTTELWIKEISECRISKQRNLCLYTSEIFRT